mmetsp:Transcript_26107/g.30139  ORF Transcript_26107/g.30139 Transcript_26107/m.30139 type:complete len:96 (-) Transcript_26107:17-304(-)
MLSIPYKSRQKSHQTVNINAFRDKLKTKTVHRSFRKTHRLDIDGNSIRKGGYHKIRFADQIKENKDMPLATTYRVESFKKYNGRSCFDNCSCSVF